jgi:hypothetical protein
MGYSFGYKAPVIEMKYTVSFLIVPREPLKSDDKGANHLYNLKICGESLLNRSREDGLPHTITALDTTLSLLNELTRNQPMHLDFALSYFYITRKSETKEKEEKEKYKTYYAISPTANASDSPNPTTSDSLNGKQFILPARFLMQTSPDQITGNISECIHVTDSNGSKKISLRGLYHSKYNHTDSHTIDQKYLKQYWALEKDCLSLNRLKKVDKLFKTINGLKQSGFVKTKCNILSFNRSCDETIHLTLDMHVSCYRYFWGEHTKFLPFPNFPDPGEQPKSGILLGIDNCWWTDLDIREIPEEEKKNWDTTIALWAQIDALKPILLDQGNQTVLVTGEPGSGKEVFSKVIHYGSVRKKTGDAGIKTRSVANMDSDQLSKLLCGYVIQGVKFPGLIADAKGGTLFLDEVDKINESDYYSEFLRILEAREYVPVGSAIVEKVSDVNWIFAGAFTGKNSSKSTFDIPPDFWSRLTARINIKNPLKCLPRKMEINVYSKKISYAGALFIYFLMSDAVKLAGSIDALMAEKPSPGFPADYARALMGIKRDSNDIQNIDFGWCIMAEHFQKQIDNGRYFSCDARNKDGKSEIKWCQYEQQQRIIKPETIDCMCKFDSVRAIIKAAKSGFTLMANAAMTDKEFWNSQNDANSIILQKIRKESIERAADLVKKARPGEEQVYCTK